jgi:hypothetical protein
VQLKNALLWMVVIEDGNIISVKPVQPENATPSIPVINSLKITLFKLVTFIQM